ncbi:hypothetical protein [uncultured Flavonifractor sp.]|uniref:hypothetical protein n=1 Tax=uncultured Flavonifractor sp. TaxID=1193534 RepID=UPI002614549B|nr:hypothetical protein [uncultured Flavonifractor sp.]
MGDWNVTLGVLLTTYAPFLLGMAAFALICLAVWPKPPRPLRILLGVLGTGLLLWALWFYIFRELLNV